MIKRFFQLAPLICVLLLNAQKPADVTVHFYDGSVLYGTAKLKDIVISTNYGKLNIPLKDVAEISFGLEKDESIAADINKYIQILANTSDEKQIQSASESISKHGLKAIYHLEKFLDKGVGAYLSNINTLINDILSNNNISDYRFNDIVVLNNGDQISGNIDMKGNIDFSNAFLSAPISTYKIKKMEISYFENSGGAFNYSVKASKHIMANNDGGWLNTGIKVKKGQVIEMSARGEIVLASLDNKKYNPDGNIAGQEINNANESDNASSAYFNYGTLIFKIGNNGKPLKAGSSVKYVADTDGVLYLTIYETVYSDKNTGAYQVKLTVK